MAHVNVEQPGLGGTEPRHFYGDLATNRPRGSFLLVLAVAQL